MEQTKRLCPRCKKSLSEISFYTNRKGEKTELCKKCLTAHVNAFNEDSFVWILKDLDYPYVPIEWNSLRDKVYAADPKRFNNSSMFGKYVAKMKLNQWKDKTFADSKSIIENTNKINDLTKEEAAELASFEQELLSKFKSGEIGEAQYRTLSSTKGQYELDVQKEAKKEEERQVHTLNNFIEQENIYSSLEKELTEEDKKYLSMKWGGMYKPYEWIQLEKKYTEMTESYDVQDPDSMGVFVLTAKTYLKMNNAIDMGDFAGYQQLTRVYDTLKKNIQSMEKKTVEKDSFDSIGQIIALCEKDGFIPRYCSDDDTPKDKVDKTLMDMNNYMQKLIHGESDLDEKIEDAVKKAEVKRELEKEQLLEELLQDDGDIWEEL